MEWGEHPGRKVVLLGVSATKQWRRASMQTLAYCEVLEPHWHEEGIRASKARMRGTVQEFGAQQTWESYPFWGGRRASQAWGVRARAGWGRLSWRNALARGVRTSDGEETLYAQEEWTVELENWLYTGELMTPINILRVMEAGFLTVGEGS